MLKMQLIDVIMEENGVENWDSDHVGEWIASIGLRKYISIFVHENVDGDILMHMDTKTLKEIGIDSAEDRKTIVNAVMEY